MTRWQPPVCPQDRDHGTLLDWPTAYAAWYCPNVRHSGSHFYRTDLGSGSPDGRRTDCGLDGRGGQSSAVGVAC